MEKTMCNSQMIALKQTTMKNVNIASYKSKQGGEQNLIIHPSITNSKGLFGLNPKKLISVDQSHHQRIYRITVATMIPQDFRSPSL